jgi:LacI family transcriptional regulator
MAAVEQLGYQPSAVARGLVKRRMDIVGVALLHWEGTLYGNAYLMSLLDGILTPCTRRRQNVMLLALPGWDDEEAGSRIADGRCDGVLLLVPPMQCPLLDTLRQRSLPFVAVNSADPLGSTASVDVDNIAASAEATRHLLELGHRRIAIVGHPWDRVTLYYQDRREGCRRAMAEAGIEGGVTELTVDEAADLDLSAAGCPTALVCAYDGIALILLQYLKKRGIRVPEDISIVSFDDIPGAAGSDPPLTTVRQPAVRLGERSVEMLLEMIANPALQVRQEILPTELIVRGSTAVVRSSRPGAADSLPT